MHGYKSPHYSSTKFDHPIKSTHLQKPDKNIIRSYKYEHKPLEEKQGFSPKIPQSSLKPQGF